MQVGPSMATLVQRNYLGQKPPWMAFSPSGAVFIMVKLAFCRDVHCREGSQIWYLFVINKKIYFILLEIYHDML